MTKKDTKPPENKESKGVRETLSWLLDILTKASGIRMNFYKQQQMVAEDFVRKIKMDEKTGAIVESSEMYCAAHANLIFLTNQTIESFHGTLTAANYLSGKRRNLAKVCSILLDPRNDKGGIISTLRKGSLSLKTRSSVISIPRLEFFQEPDRSDLNRMFMPCFERFDICTKYSLDYWDTLKPVRNAYAHNYRFIFYNVSAPIDKPQFDEAGLGLLPQELDNSFTELLREDAIAVSDFMKDMVYVGFIQRMATGKLVSLLTMFERWIYRNMRNTIWNGDEPILPESVPYLSNNDRERYTEIRDTQQYNISIPKRRDYGKYDKENQENLHKRFLFELQSKGDKFAMTDIARGEIELKFQDKEEQNDA